MMQKWTTFFLFLSYRQQINWIYFCFSPQQ